MAASASLACLALTAEASRVLDAHAEAHYGERIALVIDGTVLVAPVIHAREFGGQVQVSSSLNEAETVESAALLGAGSLPAEVELVDLGRCEGPA